MSSRHGDSFGGESAGVAAVRDAAALLARADLSGVAGPERLAEVRALWPAVSAVQAQLARRVADVHAVGAAQGDGFASTAAWLRRRLHLDGGAAATWVQVASGLAGLAEAAAAFTDGAISLPHAAAIVDAERELGAEVLAAGVEKVLVDFARENSPAELRRLIREIRLRLLDDDEAAERQVRLYEGRWLTASRTFEGMVHIEGMFDPVAGAQILAALAAYTPGPDPDRLLGRTAQQRRADAFADICAVALANTDREQGAATPHVYLTVSWETLRRDLAAAAAAAHHDEDTAHAAETDPAHHHTSDDASAADSDTDPAADGPGTSTSDSADTSTPDGAEASRPGGSEAPDGAEASTPDYAEAPRSGGARPGAGYDIGGFDASTEDAAADRTNADRSTADSTAADSTAADSTAADRARRYGDGPTVLNWATQIGACLDVDRLAEVLADLHDQLRPGGPARLGPGGEPICAETARRLACDAGVIPVVLGSASEPLDIGRLSRLVPTGLRRAVELRDQHCRFPGCDRPARWCECHHVWFWRDGGPTKLDNLVLLCRFHHVRVHDYGWLLTFDPATGVVRVTRPDGTAYDIISQRDGPSR